MLFVYPAIFHREDESYWVEFPDLKGCNTYGSTIPEAMENGDHISSPSDISAIHANDSFSSLVSCDINQYKDTKAVKKTLIKILIDPHTIKSIL